MSTRSIIVVTGQGRYSPQTVRLYKHSDGYPTGNLPPIIAALKTALAQVKKKKEKFNFFKEGINVDQVTGLLIGACVEAYGMTARAESDESKAFNPEMLGEQEDLEWIYLIDLTALDVSIYGGEYSDTGPQEIHAKGPVDPIEYAKQLKAEYISGERAAIEFLCNEIKTLGFTINKRAAA